MFYEDFRWNSLLYIKIFAILHINDKQVDEVIDIISYLKTCYTDKKLKMHTCTCM